MKRLIAAVAFATLASAPAFAADMAVKARPYFAPEPIFSWTGFYVGAHVGYYSATTQNDTVFPAQLPNASKVGAFGGFQGGYRWQMPSNLVFGVQVSAPVFATSQSETVFGTFTTHVKEKGSVIGQLQLGYAVGRWLPFLTAGVGFAKSESYETAGAVTSLTVNNTHTIGTAGFGINYAITDHFTTGIRYNHVWASKERYDCGPAVCGIVGNFWGYGDTVAGVFEYKF